MVYDPNFPQENTIADAPQMRAQFQGVIDMINAVPAGPPGAQGPPGASVSGAEVDSVTTVAPGDPASASASYDGTNIHFSFGIPRGADGTNGLNGNDGMPGPAGPPGASVTGAMVGFTLTGNPGDPASASATYDGATVRFTFVIPRGADGTNGVDGAQGPPGPGVVGAMVDSVTTVGPGGPATATAGFDGATVHFTFSIPQGEQGLQGPQDPPGPPGEVTNASLATAIAGTSANTNAVATLDTPFADPDMEALRQKLNEMILAARR
jgi:hypothetical protein